MLETRKDRSLALQYWCLTNPAGVFAEDFVHKNGFVYIITVELVSSSINGIIARR